MRTLRFPLLHTSAEGKPCPRCVGQNPERTSLHTKHTYYVSKTRTFSWIEQIRVANRVPVSIFREVIRVIMNSRSTTSIPESSEQYKRCSAHSRIKSTAFRTESADMSKRTTRHPGVKYFVLISCSRESPVSRVILSHMVVTRIIFEEASESAPQRFRNAAIVPADGAVIRLSVILWR
jgi:hypothetical protein